MELTPDQLAADGALESAIDRQHRVYDGGDGTPGVVTKYVCIAQRQWVDRDGHFASHIYTTSADDMSLADALGLCEFASTHFRSMIVHDQ